MNPHGTRYAFAEYLALKAAIALFVVAYAVVAHRGGIDSPRGEFFPVSNWSLFTAVHAKRGLLESYVHRIGEQTFAEPVKVRCHAGTIAA
jgi:hypothetical protein